MDTLILGLIVALAAGYLVRSILRAVQGRTSSCCGGCNACSAAGGLRQGDAAVQRGCAWSGEGRSLSASGGTACGCLGPQKSSERPDAPEHEP